MRLCTFNIRYDNQQDGQNSWIHRRDLVVQVIQTIQPDVLAIQECLATQAEFLRAHLPGFQFIGTGRDNGYSGEMVAVLIRNDRYHLIDCGYFWLSEEPHIPGSRSWGSSLPRMVTWTVLQPIHANSLPIWLFNVHLDHYSPNARIESARLLHKRICTLGGQLPIIMLGDFNTGPSSNELSPLLESQENIKLQDIARGIITGTYHAFTGQTTGERIDWILLSHHFAVKKVWIDQSKQNGLYPSDHFPLVADVFFK